MDVLTRPIINETKRAFHGRLEEEKESKERSWQERHNDGSGVGAYSSSSRNADRNAVSSERKSSLRGDVGASGSRSVSGSRTTPTTIVKARDNIHAPIFIPEYKPLAAAAATPTGITRPATEDSKQYPAKHVYARAVGGGIMVPSMRQGSLPAEVSRPMLGVMV